MMVQGFLYFCQWSRLNYSRPPGSSIAKRAGFFLYIAPKLIGLGQKKKTAGEVQLRALPATYPNPILFDGSPGLHPSSLPSCT